MIDQQTIKACPHCGGEGSHEKVFPPSDGYRLGRKVQVCRSCDLGFDMVVSPTEEQLNIIKVLSSFLDFKGYPSSEELIIRMIQYNDWNVWRKLENKIMDTDKLFGEMVMSFGDTLFGVNIIRYIESDLFTRCKVLVSVLKNYESN